MRLFHKPGEWNIDRSLVKGVNPEDRLISLESLPQILFLNYAKIDGELMFLALTLKIRKCFLL